MKKFYVYLYSCPIRNEYIYVGKGSGNRCEDHLSRTDNSPLTARLKWLRKQNSEPIIEIIQSGLSPKASYAIEMFFISSIGRKDKGVGSLLNLTDGGDGPVGYMHTESAKERIRKARLGSKSPESAVRNMSLAQKKRFSVTCVPDATKQKMSNAHRGLKISEETKKKMSISHGGKKMSELAKQNLSISSKGKNSKRCTVDGITIFESMTAMANALGSGKNGVRSKNFYYL